LGWGEYLSRAISLTNKRKVTALIQSECCNFISGDCIAADVQCPQIQRLKSANEKPGKSPLICGWFVNSVLPLDKDLWTTLINPQNLAKCKQCGTKFAGGSNSAKYCASCAYRERKKQQREFAQKKRLTASTNRGLENACLSGFFEPNLGV
jgi:hypothetical protein